MPVKYLFDLLHDFVPVSGLANCEVKGICLDSRQVQAGDVFLAYPGLKVDGRNFIQDAVARGAVAVIYEANNQPNNLQLSQEVPCIALPNLQRHLSTIAARFYEHPSQALQVIGITGTNGKTTCSQLLAAALHTEQTPCGVIGTLGHGIYGHLQSSIYTTPDAITTQHWLAELNKAGATAVTMEVSSHALAQHRVAAVEFSIGVFTNLTRDHLDYHQDMVDYAQAKRRLFTDFDLQYGVINADDPYGKTWLRQLHQQLPVYGYSIAQPTDLPDTIPVVYAKHVQLTQQGIKAEVHTPWGSGVLHSRLLGRFNLSNLLAITTVLGLQGFSLPEILDRLVHLQPVPGRLQALGGHGRPTVVVDFAHTPDALEQALTTVKEFCPGEVWCVFGCGGDRDRGKRALMGRMAEQYVDHIVLTNDNPRHEDPRTITAEIMQGIEKTDAVVIEHDRRQAIAHAIECADPDDVIIITGKGHEHYQQIGAEKHPFNDAVTVQTLLYPQG